MRQILLQDETFISLQIAAKVYYKMCQVFYYKMRQLLQNTTFITKLVGTHSVLSSMMMMWNCFYGMVD